MKIHLIAAGKRMPSWIQEGYMEYAKRLPNDYALHLIEIDAGKRTKGTDVTRLVHAEGELMLTSIPTGSHIIALDVKGKMWDTPLLAQYLQKWHDENRDISLLIGGPEGLAPACLAKAHAHWSLSGLTLPHPLVRVILAEQLYRAWSMLHNHPYHRA